MKTSQIIKKLNQFRQKQDAEGALAFIDDLPDETLSLHAVIQSGWAEIIPQLDHMRFCEAICSPDEQNRFALHLAAEAGPEMLRACLLESIDAGLFEFDNEELTPAMIAAGRGDIESLRILARAGADFDQVSEEMGNTALESACLSGNLVAVQYLLDAGADATLPNMDQLSSESGYDDAINMIDEAAKLRAGADQQRLKTIQVSMGAGEASFIMPARLAETGDLFISDVIGDLRNGAKPVQFEHGERAFGDEPHAGSVAATLGLGEVADRINRKREIEKAAMAANPKGNKPH